jgi:hypothetical protein
MKIKDALLILIHNKLYKADEEYTKAVDSITEKIKRNDETLLNELNEFARYVWLHYGVSKKFMPEPSTLYEEFILSRLKDFKEENKV